MEMVVVEMVVVEMEVVEMEVVEMEVVVAAMMMMEEKAKTKRISWRKGPSNTQPIFETDQEAVKKDCFVGKTASPAGNVHYSPMLRWRSSSL
jgi:hypothetical protein